MFNKIVPVTERDMLLSDKLVVVMNLANHESLVAGMLFKLVTATLKNIKVIDVRDPLSTGTAYVWIGCGEQAVLEDYYREQLDRKDFNTIMRNSIFLNRTGEVDVINVADGLVSKVADLVDIMDVDSTIIRKWMIPSMNFHANEMEHAIYCQYYKLLDTFVDVYYCGIDDDIDVLGMSIEASDQDIKRFEAKHQRFNKVLRNKIREYGVSGNPYVQLSTLGPDVYVILRRFGMADKAFMHVSQGSYGKVIYSNTKKGMSLYGDHQTGLLKLSQE